eukprot:8443607-Pyramimonas_sp.AAC.1
MYTHEHAYYGHALCHEHAYGHALCHEHAYGHALCHEHASRTARPRPPQGWRTASASRRSAGAPRHREAIRRQHQLLPLLVCRPLRLCAVVLTLLVCRPLRLCAVVLTLRLCVDPFAFALSSRRS